MAEILLGWELGANTGHARRLEALVPPLLAQGHGLHLVVQNLGAVQIAPAWQGRVRLWQAPLWPGLLRHGGAGPLGPPRRFGDVLANLGLTSAAGFAAILGGWDALLAAIRPALVIGDFAPGLMLAARGRVPRLAVGTGFTVPPADLPEFPAFLPAPPAPLVTEAALLTLVNDSLSRLGWPALTALPQIMGAEAARPAVFAPLDPYRPHRRHAPLSPVVPPAACADPGRAARPGVFAYLPGAGLGAADLARLAAMARKGPVTAHLPGLAAEHAASLRQAGLRLVAQPLGWEAIARDHTLVLCHGGMGTVSAALIAGLALAVWPGGIEQRLTAAALAAAGWSLPAEADLTEAARDRAVTQAARDRAMAVREGYHDPLPGMMAAIAALLAENR